MTCLLLLGLGFAGSQPSSDSQFAVGSTQDGGATTELPPWQIPGS